MRQESARFTAENSAGDVFNIVAYQNYVVHKPLYGSATVLEGALEFWTDTGLQVTKINSEYFRIESTGEIIKPVS